MVGTMSTYEVRIQTVRTKIYHVKAKDDADLIEKNKRGLIGEEGEFTGIAEAENKMNSWKDISKRKEK